MIPRGISIDRFGSMFLRIISSERSRSISALGPRTGTFATLSRRRFRHFLLDGFTVARNRLSIIGLGPARSLGSQLAPRVGCSKFYGKQTDSTRCAKRERFRTNVSRRRAHSTKMPYNKRD